VSKATAQQSSDVRYGAEISPRLLLQHAQEPCEQAEPECATCDCVLPQWSLVALTTRPSTSAPPLKAILVFRVASHAHTHTMAYPIAVYRL
jgi:hypothetical protein